MSWRQRILAIFRFIESGGANRILHRSTSTPHHPPGEMAVTNGDNGSTPWADKARVKIHGCRLERIDGRIIITGINEPLGKHNAEVTECQIVDSERGATTAIEVNMQWNETRILGLLSILAHDMAGTNGDNERNPHWPDK